MRQLTNTQKRVLDKFMDQNTGVSYWDDLPQEIIDELERINDTEILWQEVNRYMSDKRMERL